MTTHAFQGYNKQTNANAKVGTVTSLGTGFDLLLARGALCALGLAALWAAVVAATAAIEAYSHGSVRLAERIGCPRVVRAWLVAAFVALFAGVAPAHAGDAGSGTGSSGVATGTAIAASLDGLPLPDRSVSSASTRDPLVVVRSGDSLWRIARRILPADASDAAVSEAVARLYAANRVAIGTDPDLLRPGQRLAIGVRTRFPAPPTLQEES